MNNVKQTSGAAVARRKAALTRRRQKLSYMSRWLPSYFWQRLTRPNPAQRTHLILVLADHFAPAIVPENGAARSLYGAAHPNFAGNLLQQC